MVEKNFLEDRYTLREFMCDEKVIPEPEIIKFVNSDKACEMLLYHIKNKSKIRLHADVDVDGIATTYVINSFVNRIKDGDLDIGYAINGRKVHGLNKEIIDHFNKAGIDLLIVLDSGTNDVNLFDKAEFDIIVIDHHEVSVGLRKLRGNTKSGDYVVVNNTADNEDMSFIGDNAMSAGLVAYEFVRYFQRKYSLPDIAKDTKLYQWSAISLVTDSVYNDKLRNIYYLKKTYSDTELESGLGTLIKNMSKYNNKLSKSFIGYTLAPMFNRTIRAKRGGLALSVALEHPESVGVLQEFRALQDKVVKDYLDGVSEHDKFVSKDISNKDIRDYSGLIATKMLDYYKKTAIVYEVENEYACGSFRGKIDNLDYRSEVKSFGFYAEGHDGAFGFKIPLKYVTSLMNKITELEVSYSVKDYLTLGEMPEEEKGIHHIDVDDLPKFKRDGYLYQIGLINQIMNREVEIIVHSENISLLEKERGTGKRVSSKLEYNVFGMTCDAFQPITSEYASIYIEFQGELKFYIKNKWR